MSADPATPGSSGLLPVMTDNPAAHRFEATVDDAVAGFAEYELSGDTMILPHTEVDPSFGGQGVGSALARFALDEARRRGVTVLPLCSFIRGYLERHPDDADLLADRHRDRWA